jgi:hypothetical protein
LTPWSEPRSAMSSSRSKRWSTAAKRARSAVRADRRARGVVLRNAARSAVSDGRRRARPRGWEVPAAARRRFPRKDVTCLAPSGPAPAIAFVGSVAPRTSTGALVFVASLTSIRTPRLRRTHNSRAVRADPNNSRRLDRAASDVDAADL